MGKIVKSMQLLDKKVRVILSYATGKLRLLGVFRFAELQFKRIGLIRSLNPCFDSESIIS